MKRSRLSRRINRQNQKTLLLSVLGIALLLVLIFKLGIPFLVTVGNLFEKTESLKPNSSAKADFVAIPGINDLPNATNKSEIKVEGSAEQNTIIELFVNGSKTDQAKTTDSGSFSFNASLSEGENIIKARAKKDEVTSDFSTSQTILYRNSPPSLTIDSPSDGSQINSDSVEVKGTTDEDVRVTVNDFWAIIKGDNTYSYNLHLSQGENRIKVIAIDEAGNKAEKEIKVSYSP